MDFEIMTVLLFEPQLCTKHELDSIYDLEDLYDFLEIIEAKNSIEEEIQKKEQQKVQAR
jgi:hypothetical protein